MDNELLTAPPGEGSGEGTPSQATGTTEQSDGQQQSQGVGEVDPNVQSASSEASERPKASEFYGQRKKIKTLETEVTTLKGA